MGIAAFAKKYHLFIKNEKSFAESCLQAIYEWRQVNEKNELIVQPNESRHLPTLSMGAEKRERARKFLSVNDSKNNMNVKPDRMTSEMNIPFIGDYNIYIQIENKRTGVYFFIIWCIVVLHMRTLTFLSFVSIWIGLG